MEELVLSATELVNVWIEHICTNNVELVTGKPDWSLVQSKWTLCESTEITNDLLKPIHQSLNEYFNAVNDKLSVLSKTQQLYGISEISMSDLEQIFRLVAVDNLMLSGYISTFSRTFSVDQFSHENSYADEVYHLKRSGVNSRLVNMSADNLMALNVSLCEKWVNQIVKAITSYVLPCFASIPSPYIINTHDWAHLFNTIKQSGAALHMLYNSCQSCNSLLSAVRNILIDILSKWTSLIATARDISVLSVSSYFHTMVVDNVNRQDWASHSAYMRDKKVTHGVSAMTSSIKALLYDLKYYCGGGSESCSLEQPSIIVHTGLQLLLASLTIVLRTYVLLQPSRTRLFQWRVDLYHTVYTTIDTLLWLVKHQQEMNIANNCDKQLPIVDDSMFWMVEDRELIAELYIMLLYLLCMLWLVTGDGDKVLAGAMDFTDSQVNIVENTPSDAVVLENIMQLLSSLNIADEVKTKFSVSHIKNISSSTLLFNMTDETMSYSTAMDVDYLQQLTEEQMALLNKDAKTKPGNPFVGPRAICFNSIITMSVDKPELLLNSIHRNGLAFLELHQQIVCREVLFDSSNSDYVKSINVDFVHAMLRRRYEVIDCEYPKLTADQLEMREKINKIIDLT